MDLVGICMDTLLLTPVRGFFFWIIEFVVECTKIDAIPFFSPHIVVDELRKIGERLSLGEASRH